jgi:DNA-binding transcriptional ArsR family regulator
MGSTFLIDTDDWDLEQFRSSPGMTGAAGFRRKLPRHQPRDPFIKGPIPYTWMVMACRLSGSGLQVAMFHRFLCSRFRSRNRWGLDKIARGLRISEDSARRGLHVAELAGLLSVVRKPGCKRVVSVSDLAESDGRPTHRPLYGPIPWTWWLPASRLPGRSLQVASVLWLLAGWERSADFELASDDWAEFGLSRSSASRGLDELERAGLIAAVRRHGRTPMVSILDPIPHPPRTRIP